MARAKKNQIDNTINIKSLPVQCHVGASKFVNDDWGTMAFSIPRNQIQNKFADMELRYNFIYFLFGYEGSKEVVYVGQAKKRNDGESVLKRLREHDKSMTERYRDKWSWIVAVTNKNDAWGLDDLNALEHAFYNEIPSEQNLNGNNPNSGGANYDTYIDKISQIKSLITAVGFNIFSAEETTEKIQVTSEVNEYTIVEDLQNGMARIPEIVTPLKVVKAMVDMLPKEVWNSKTKFLDPACKGGEYLREIYDRLMDTETLQAEFPNAIERSNHILKNQIYGIALSQVSLERTTKKLLGEDRNIRVIPNYIGILKNKDLGRENNIADILSKEFGGNMKFDVVIGNPPYQENTGGGRCGGRPLYTFFVQMAEKLTNRYSLMIIPARWYVPNKDISDFTIYMLSNKHIKNLVDYENSAEVFSGVSIPGGICYYLYDNKYTGDPLIDSHVGVDEHIFTDKRALHTLNIRDGAKIFPMFLRHKTDVLILLNILKLKEDTMYRTCSNVSPFGLKTTFEGNIIQTNYYNIEVICSYDNVTYANESDITKGADILGKYNIVLNTISPDGGGELQGNYNQYAVVAKPKILKPNQACTLTYIVLNSVNTAEEAINCQKYVKTKFVRSIIKMFVSSAYMSAKTFQYIPLQDFTSDAEIDWSKSISDIDQQLYKKYGLSQEEIDYIEKTIKPME